MEPYDKKYPCPCCGYLVNALPPGYHEVCPICQWEDELAQLRFPEMPGIANHVCLKEAQKNFINFGASEKLKTLQGRRPSTDDLRDSEWRPLDIEHDNIEAPARGIDYASSYPQDTTVLYYWHSTYWRKLVS